MRVVAYTNELLRMKTKVSFVLSMKRVISFSWNILVLVHTMPFSLSERLIFTYDTDDLITWESETFSRLTEWSLTWILTLKLTMKTTCVNPVSLLHLQNIMIRSSRTESLLLLLKSALTPFKSIWLRSMTINMNCWSQMKASELNETSHLRTRAMSLI